MIVRLRSRLFAGLMVTLGLCGPSLAGDVPELIKTINAVGPEGQGNAAAVAAVRELSQTPPGQIVTLLTALDSATPRARNALRAAVQTVAQKGQGKLPAAGLEAFVKDQTHDPAARKLAFDLLVKADPTASERLVPGMINDGSNELRRLAVQRLIDAAEKQPEIEAKATWQQAMQAARDSDQIKIAAKKLEGFGEKINLTQHFGFLTKWTLIGPFDNREKKGFDVAYPPEKAIDLKAELEGKDGKPVTWALYEAPEDATEPEKCGIVDVAKARGTNKGAVFYGVTEFDSPRAQPVELRLGTYNAWKIWVNGEFLFGREEYHRGERLDQYKLKANFKAGKNVILIKVCENEQTEDWAQDFKFRLRVCDHVGTAIPSTEKMAAK